MNRRHTRFTGRLVLLALFIMAGSSFFALLDDIATVLDDVAVLSKIAAKQTAGVLGDDLALNAQQVAGVHADRELPVVWAVAKGSLRNKAILVPLALAISALVPWAVMPLLMVGGAYLCYEGFEKVAEFLSHDSHAKEEQRARLLQALETEAIDLVAFEREKVKGAIRTDFVLSAEIIVIALGTVAGAPFVTRLIVLAAVGVLMTVGVYGVVGAIVKLDDAGLYLLKRPGEGFFRTLARSIGTGLLRAAPVLMKVLSVVGTLAMFLVGGGILMHAFPQVHEEISHAAPYLASILNPLINGLVGVALGGVLVALHALYTKIRH